MVLPSEIQFNSFQYLLPQGNLLKLSLNYFLDLACLTLAGNYPSLNFVKNYFFFNLRVESFLLIFIDYFFSYIQTDPGFYRRNSNYHHHYFKLYSNFH